MELCVHTSVKIAIATVLFLTATLACYIHTGIETITFATTYLAFTHKDCGLFGLSRCKVTRTGYELRFHTRLCKVDGGWTSFSYGAWRVCSRPCGGGTQMRVGIRNCTNPMPLNGGSSCSGRDDNKQWQACNTQNCTRDHPDYYGWTDFDEISKWGKCSRECDAGLQWRTLKRRCVNPEGCVGSDTKNESRRCFEHACPESLCKKERGGYFPYWAKKNQFIVCKNGTVNIFNCSKSDMIWNERSFTCTFHRKRKDGTPCKEGERVPHSTDCSKYIQCTSEGNGTIRSCPEGKWSDTIDGMCRRQDNVTCSEPRTGGFDCPRRGYFKHPLFSRYIYKCLGGPAVLLDCRSHIRYCKAMLALKYTRGLE